MGAIGREQQQRLGGAIRFDHCRQKIGDRRTGCCDHRHSVTGSGGHSKGQESSGTLINGGGEHQLSPGSEMSRRRGQGAGATARAEHQTLQTLTPQSLQKGQSSLEIGMGNGQGNRPGW